MKIPYRVNRTDGSALLTVLVIVTVLALLLGSIIGASVQQAYKARRLANYMRAKAIAEAGANFTYSVLVTNWNMRTSSTAFPRTSFGAKGTYDASVVPVGEYLGVIYSTGYYDNAVARAVLDAKNYAITRPAIIPSLDPFYYTIFCDKNMTGNGNCYVQGTVFCNGNVGTTGTAFDWGTWGDTNKICHVVAVQSFDGSGDVKVNGTLWTATNKVDAAHYQALSTVIGQIARIKFPTLNTAPYYQIANSQSPKQVINGDYIISANLNWGTPPGGVKWVNGKLTVKSGKNLTLNGCLIATGDIDVQGGITITRYSSFPALVSTTGKINIGGGHDISGLVYCPGDFWKHGNGTIRGSVMTGGNFDINGNVGIIATTNIVPQATGQPGYTRPLIGISAWQE